MQSGSIYSVKRETDYVSRVLNFSRSVCMRVDEPRVTPGSVSEMGSVASVACAHIDRHSGGEHLKVQSAAAAAGEGDRPTLPLPTLRYSNSAITHARTWDQL